MASDGADERRIEPRGAGMAADGRPGTGADDTLSYPDCAASLANGCRLEDVGGTRDGWGFPIAKFPDARPWEASTSPQETSNTIPGLVSHFRPRRYK